MNYLLYRRLRGPIFLLTFGVTAALAQWHVLSFGRSWPLYLIVYGVIRLAEGTALASFPQVPVYPAPGGPAQGYPAAGYTAPSYSGAGYQPVNPAASAPGTGLATVAPATLQAPRTAQTASSTASSTEEES